MQSQRKLINYGLARVRRWRKRLRVIRRPPVRRSPYDNIFHCCTQKTASQWFKAVFSDPQVFRYTGLDASSFTDWRKQLLSKCFDSTLSLLEVSAHLYAGHPVSVPLPRRTIGTTLYIGRKTCAMIPKPASYRTFFILRDPRDIVVSWYFSTRYSHVATTSFLLKFRSDLESLNGREGLRYSIDRLEEFGLFTGQRSWMEGSEDDANTKIFRYEDFARDNCLFLKHLFAYLDINMPKDEFEALSERHRFEVYSGERSQGLEEIRSHYRKGVVGDWQNHLDFALLSYFRRVTGDLLEVLGYS